MSDEYMFGDLGLEDVQLGLTDQTYPGRCSLSWVTKENKRWIKATFTVDDANGPQAKFHGMHEDQLFSANKGDTEASKKQL